MDFGILSKHSLARAFLCNRRLPRNHVTDIDSEFASAYLNVLWTIPAEFRGSIAVFWFLTASTSLSTRARRIFALFVILLCYLWGALYITSFLVGMLIADFATDRTQPPDQSSTLPTEDKTSIQSCRRLNFTTIFGWGCLLFLGVFLLGQPNPDHFGDGNYPFPWKYLHAIVPPWYNWRQGEEFWYVVTPYHIPRSLLTPK